MLWGLIPLKIPYLSIVEGKVLGKSVIFGICPSVLVWAKKI